MTLNKDTKILFIILFVTAFIIIKSFYPVLLYLLYFLASPNFIMLNGLFGALSCDLEVIVYVYTISLGITFLLKYFEKRR
jgi:hypothetical protein